MNFQRGGTGRLPPESKCPELLAIYCDMLLRKTLLSKKLTGREIENRLRDVVCMFRLLVRTIYLRL